MLELPTKDVLSISKYSEILIGWILGLVSGPVLKWLYSKCDKREFIKGLRTEITETRFQLATILHSVAHSVKMYDKEFLIWLKYELKFYNGIHPSAKLVQGLDALLTIDENNLAKVQEFISATSSNKGKSIPLLETLYLDSKMDKIATLTERQQALILNIKKCLNIVNSKITEAAQWEKMTFEVTTGQNYDAVVENSKSCLESMFYSSKEAICSMHEFLSKT